MNYTVLERMRNAQIPDYYDTMYLDGYKPWQIIEAAHNSIIKEHEKREDAAPAQIHITSEVKTK